MTAASGALRKSTANSALLALILTLALAAPAVADEIDVRLLSNPAITEARLLAPGGRLVDATGRSVDAAACRLRLRSEKAAIVCGDEGALTSPVTLEQNGAPLFELDVNGQRRRYPGRLKLIRTADGLAPILTIDLEQYVAGVIVAETENDHDEYFKAMAICARSFAVHHLRRRRGPLADHTAGQSFRGLPDNARVKRATQAAEATRGQVLRVNGEPAPAYYHACCGGRTRDVREVWPDAPAYAHLRGVADRNENGQAWCRDNRWFSWQRKIPADDFRAFLRERYRAEQAQRESETAPVTLLDADRRRTVDPWRFRRALGRRLGWNLAPSDRFVIAGQDAAVVLTGHGFGHRVGLCQAGALAQARAGRTAEQILNFYFPGASLNP